MVIKEKRKIKAKNNKKQQKNKSEGTQNFSNKDLKDCFCTDDF
jgi:hypothetical protein